MGKYSGCRWAELKKLPPGIVDLAELKWDATLPGKDLGTYDERGGMLIEVIVKDIVLQGEDASDAFAIAWGSEVAFAEHDGVLYAAVISDDYNRAFKFVCGIQAALPWMIALGAAGAVGGFVLGDKYMGHRAMGVTLGLLTGAAGGYGVQRISKA